MKKFLTIAIMLVLVFALVGCAAGPNDMVNTAPEGETAAGFWLGLWQGFISLFTFIVSLFNDNVSMYEVHNNGGWYNFGYIIGVSAFFGGGGGGASRRRRD